MWLWLTYVVSFQLLVPEINTHSGWKPVFYLFMVMVRSVFLSTVWSNLAEWSALWKNLLPGVKPISLPHTYITLIENVLGPYWENIGSRCWQYGPSSARSVQKMRRVDILYVYKKFPDHITDWKIMTSDVKQNRRGRQLEEKVKYRYSLCESMFFQKRKP